MLFVYEYKGEFWLPSKDKGSGENKDRIKGEIQIKPDGGVSVILNDAESLCVNHDKIIRKKIMLGNITDVIFENLQSKITLVENGLFLSEDREGKSKCVGSPSVVIIGDHFNNIDDIKFQKLTVQYDYLPKWVFEKETKNLNAKNSFEVEEGVKVSLKIDLDRKDAYFNIKFESEKSLKSKKSNKSKKNKNDENDKKDEEEMGCLEIEENIRQFLNFVSGWKFDITKFKALNKREVEIIRPRAMNLNAQNLIIPYEPFIAFKDVCDSFDNYLKKWFEIMKNKNIRAAINYQLYTDYDIGIPEFTFLTHVFILEMYHYHSTEFETSMFEREEDWETWKTLKSKLENIIDTNLNKSIKDYEGIKSSLENKLEYMHEKSLRRKLKEILKFLGDDIVAIIFNKKATKKINKKEINNFIGEVTDYRNKMVHELELPPLKELEELNPKLKAIFKACILKDLGFDDKTIIESINKYLKMLEKYQPYQVSLD